MNNILKTMKKINIAIDGHSSCGKSTLAKALAAKLHYLYIDSGAMYRAVTLYFLNKGTDINNAEVVKAHLEEITISFKNHNGENRTLLNDADVSEEIRSMAINNFVSPVAAISSVRKKLVHQQQIIGSKKGVVMDGRDIGTVVFPDAEIKIFLTANIETRAQRRFDELRRKGNAVSLEEIKYNLAERDRIDSNRLDSPLKQAQDAILLDNSNLTPIEQCLFVYNLTK